MKHRNSHLLVGYWSRLRRGRGVPDQGDIDPRAIKRMLSQIFILEAADPVRATYRLAGTGLCDRFGFELRGTSFLATWEMQSRNALVSLLKQSLALKQPAYVTALAACSQGTMLEAEIVLAPISFGEGEPNRFLGMTQIMGDPAQAVGQTIAFQRFVGSRLLEENEPLSPSSVPPPPASPGETVHPRASHLRLVVSHKEPLSVRRDMDADVRELIAALDIRSALSLLG